MKTISAQELNTIITTGLPKNALIVDVRTKEEHAAGHIPGAINWVLDNIGTHINELKQYEIVYMHCQSGGRSGIACGLVIKEIPNATNVEGGFKAWQNAGYDCEV